MGIQPAMDTRDNEPTGASSPIRTEMSADTDDDEPFGLLYSFGVVLWIAQLTDVDTFPSCDLLGRAMTNEDGLVTPFKNGIFAYGNGVKANFDLGQRHDIPRRSDVSSDVSDDVLCHIRGCDGHT